MEKILGEMFNGDQALEKMEVSGKNVMLLAEARAAFHRAFEALMKIYAEEAKEDGNAGSNSEQPGGAAAGADQLRGS